MIKAGTKERFKTLKTMRREGRHGRAQNVWCKHPIPEKEKIEKPKKEKCGTRIFVAKPKNSKKIGISVIYVRACAREKAKNG